MTKLMRAVARRRLGSLIPDRQQQQEEAGGFAGKLTNRQTLGTDRQIGKEGRKEGSKETQREQM